MRSALLILISAYYLATSSGIQLNIHFCSSKLDSITFFSKAECCCDGKPSKKSCCCDNENYLKITDAHHYSKYDLSSPDWVNVFSFYIVPDPYKYAPVMFSFFPENKDGPPPLSSSSELNILQRVLRL
jgi:hypothetical protein